MCVSCNQICLLSPFLPVGALVSGSGEQVRGAWPSAALQGYGFQKGLCAAVTAGPGQACPGEMQDLLQKCPADSK